MTNLCAALVTAKERNPHGVALRLDEVELTFAELDAAAGRVATLLDRAGVGSGDRVGVMLPNTPAFAVAFYAILYRGAIVVPINPLLKSGEVDHHLADSGAKALFVAAEFAAEATAVADQKGVRYWVVDDAGLAVLTDDLPGQESPAQCGDDDAAVVLYTSGTTGRPKGAMLTHGGMGRNADVALRTLLEVGPDDVLMGCLPLFHVFGLNLGLLVAVSAGATLTLMSRFEPRKALEVIDRDAVTVFAGVPTMYAALLNVAGEAAPGTAKTLQTCLCGGAPLPVQLLTEFEKEFGCRILEGYGLSESSSAASFNHPNRPRKAGSIGTPIEGVEMRVVGADGTEVAPGQTGEIQIRGHNVMKGYWNRPAATAATITADGWLNTGDVGRVDADGYFYVVDRTKDVIIRGGYNVYPREIEEVLYAHPAVAEAAVIGVPHDSLGEEVGAAVTLKTGALADPNELREYVKARVAAYKYPRRVWLIDALPKGPTGKVQKRDIRIFASETAVSPTNISD